MRQYEQVFANPLLAMAFKDGVDFVGDPDMRAHNPKKAIDGTSNWVVVIEDDTDEDEYVGEVVAPKIIVEEVKPKAKPTFEQYKTLTQSNLTSKVMAKREPITTTITTIAEPKKSPAPRGTRIIIPEDCDDGKIERCGKCLNCRSAGQDCLEVINAACALMSGRER